MVLEFLPDIQFEDIVNACFQTCISTLYMWERVNIRNSKTKQEGIKLIRWISPWSPAMKRRDLGMNFQEGFASWFHLGE